MKKYKTYCQAKFWAKNLGLSCAREWREYCSKNSLPNVPTHPDRYYENKGWDGWNEWLGTFNASGGQRKHNVNEHFFKAWSADVAYILGFWWADGFIDAKRYIFAIVQYEKEKDLLMTIRNKMGYDGNIGEHGENGIDLRICSKKIVSDIIELGGVERKSHNAIFPYIPEKFMSDFIRGYFDGDGTIYYNRQCKAYMSSFASGSIDFIKKLHEKLKVRIDGLKGNIYKVGESDNYNLMFGVNDTKRLKGFLYHNQNGIRMIRKFELFHKLGSIRVASFNKNFLSYQEAQKIVSKLGLKTTRQWREWRRGKPDNIPSAPDKIYKNKGWVNWKEWLRYEH